MPTSWRFPSTLSMPLPQLAKAHPFGTADTDAIGCEISHGWQAFGPSYYRYGPRSTRREHVWHTHAARILQKRYVLRRAEKACARSCLCERWIARALLHAGSLRMQLSRFMASASRALYSDLAASRCARTRRSWLQSTCKGNSRRKVGVFARFMMCSAFSLGDVSCEQGTRTLALPLFLLFSPASTKLFFRCRLFR